MGKAIIVYYSFEGNTKFIAEHLAQKLGADLLALKPEKEIQTHGFMKYFWGGFQALMKTKPKLLNYSFDANDYDTIIIGSPVWVFTYSSPIHSFLSENTIKNKKVGFFCCHEGGKGKTVESIENRLREGNEYLGSVDIVSPLTNENFSFVLLDEWIETLK